MRRTLLALLALGLPAAAVAYPYDLYAKFQPPEEKAEPILLMIPTDGTTIVPSDPVNAKFQGLFLRTKTDPLAKSALSRLENVLVRVCAARGCDKPAALAETTIPLSGGANGDGTEHLVYAPPQQGEPGRSVSGLYVDVYPKYTGAYLCDEERRLREEHGQRIVKEKPEDLLKGDGKQPWSKYAYGMLFERGLTTPEDQPIVYSFCPNVNDQIDWVKVAKRLEATGDKDGSKTHAAQKDLLSVQVVDRIKKDTGDEVIRAQLQGEPRTTVYSHLSHPVSMLRDTSDLQLNEGTRPLEGITDNSSQITLSVRPGSHFCSEVVACNSAIGTLLRARISYVDKEGGKPVETDAPLTPLGNAWMIEPNLTKYPIGKQLTIVVSYVVKGDTRLDLFVRKTQVEKLGVISTFPGVSEIQKAISNEPASPEDIGTQSSVPVSWAINLSHGESSHLAVTFPWMLGFNFRAAPRLADVIKIFPHISIVFPLESDPRMKTAKAAFGAGFALADAFTFSVATTVKDSPQWFFLVGISAPDLAKAFTK